MTDDRDDDRREESPDGPRDAPAADPDADRDVDAPDEPTRGPDPDLDGSVGSGPDAPDREPGEAPDVDPDRRRAADTADRTGAGRSGAESNRTGGPVADERSHERRAATEDRRRNAPLISGIAAVIGAWVAISVLAFEGFGDAALWNNVVVGVAILGAASYNYYRLARDHPASVGVASLVALLGIWLIVAGAVLEMSWGAVWSTVASGALVAVLAGYNAYEARTAKAVTGEGEANAR